MRSERIGASAVGIALLAATMLAAPPTHATTQVVFSFSGADQTWTVPAGVSVIEVTMVGAGGAGGQAGGGSLAFGGGGGAVTGVLSVTPGDVLTIIVGQGGINDNVSEPRDRNYRYGGGASGAGVSGSWPNTWGSGGGRSAIRSTSARYATTGDVITAGAGGGGGYSLSQGAGGAGGGLNGIAGGQGDTTNGGGGGTQSAGGAFGGPSEPGVAGIQYAGGYAVISGASEGGGGGGGYYGGGGAGNNGGGGGGSSYLGSAAYFAGSTTAGSGRIAGITTWPLACGTNPGRGADPGSSALVGLGGHGCVVIDFAPGSSDPETPPPWLQAYGRPAITSVCSEGWNPSWAEWPNRYSGGYTCERRIQYVAGTWFAIAGFPI